MSRDVSLNMQIFWKILLFYLYIGFFCTPSNASDSGMTYTSPEHVSLGNEVRLALDDPHSPEKSKVLHLPNGLNLTYGIILSLGDFYGDPLQPISRGKSLAEMRRRFLAAFNAFAVNKEAVLEVPKIITLMRHENAMIEDGVKRGETEEEIYSKCGLDYVRQYNCVTGGGCSKSMWWLSTGRFLQLASSNFDHFGADALHVYQIGHGVAMEEAIVASQTQNVARLEHAYAMNAFACHFLSDRYASGHMRTPRNELAHEVTPKVVGDLLSGIMHDEENQYGLHVHNARGDHWIAYGDKSLFSPKSDENRAFQLEALQRSADQIYYAYQNGRPPSDDGIEHLLPFADETSAARQRDIAPLFYWNARTKKLMRRVHLNNPYDAHWTANWWSWSTLLAFNNKKPLPIEMQAALAQSTVSNEAVADGLITDQQVLEYTLNSSFK